MIVISLIFGSMYIFKMKKYGPTVKRKLLSIGKKQTKDGDFLKLISEIIVEIVLKESNYERDRIRKIKHKRSI